MTYNTALINSENSEKILTFGSKSYSFHGFEISVNPDYSINIEKIYREVIDSNAKNTNDTASFMKGVSICHIQPDQLPGLSWKSITALKDLNPEEDYPSLLIGIHEWSRLINDYKDIEFKEKSMSWLKISIIFGIVMSTIGVIMVTGGLGGVIAVGILLLWCGVIPAGAGLPIYLSEKDEKQEIEKCFEQHRNILEKKLNDSSLLQKNKEIEAKIKDSLASQEHQIQDFQQSKANIDSYKKRFQKTPNFGELEEHENMLKDRQEALTKAQTELPEFFESLQNYSILQPFP